jgi:hypothetical protein
MPIANTSRRLSPQVIGQDIDSLNGLKTIANYSTTRADASINTLQQAYQIMLAQQQEETEKLALYRAAADAARLAHHPITPSPSYSEPSSLHLIVLKGLYL